MVITMLHSVVESFFHESQLEIPVLQNICRIKEIKTINCSSFEDKNASSASDYSNASKTIGSTELPVPLADFRSKRYTKQTDLEKKMSYVLMSLSLEVASSISEGNITLNEQRKLGLDAEDLFQTLSDKIYDNNFALEISNEPALIDILSPVDELNLTYEELLCVEGEIAIPTDISIICSMFSFQLMLFLQIFIYSL